MGAAAQEFENWQRENRLGRFTVKDDTGLEGRYEVRKINDPHGKHDDCRYFVLDPQHDPLAREALKTYSAEAEVAGYHELAADLMTWLNDAETDADNGECDHPGIEHGPFSYTGICPRCHKCRFIGHGPLCIKCCFNADNGGGEGQ